MTPRSEVGRPRVAASRVASVAVLLTLLALFGSGCGILSGNQRTIRLLSQLTSSANRHGGTVGSQLLITSMLFRSSAGAAVGRSQAACTRTAAGDGEVYQCQLTFILADGSLYGQAIASSQGPGSGAVTGGTGTYQKARGTFLYSATGSPRVKLILDLVTG